MTVKAVKLISGEELVGEVVHEERGNDGFIEEVTLKNVVAILIQRAPDGNLNVAFIPFAPYLGRSATFDFKHDKLLFVKEVDEQMANQYNAMFGGIVTPPKSILLG